MIDTALKAVADHIEDHATVTAWDVHRRLTPEQEAAKAEKIRAVAGELRSLAEAAGTRKILYGEYQVLKDRLYAFEVPLPPRLEQDIAAAFHAAKGPDRPRDKGWLKRP